MQLFWKHYLTKKSSNTKQSYEIWGNFKSKTRRTKAKIRQYKVNRGNKEKVIKKRFLKETAIFLWLVRYMVNRINYSKYLLQKDLLTQGLKQIESTDSYRNPFR